MLKIAIILGSTRPGRNGEAVSQWMYEIAKKRNDANFELLDIKDYNLPLLDEPIPPSMGQYTKEHTKTWALKIDSFDAYVFVTAEYNHVIPGALKNAIDFLNKEWSNKVAGFVSYGGAGGVRSVEQLRLVMAELRLQLYVHRLHYRFLQISKTLQSLSPLHSKRKRSTQCWMKLLRGAAL